MKRVVGGQLGWVRKSIGALLANSGMRSVSNPRALFEQLAEHIHTHEQFRDLLLKYEPDKRERLYEAMCGKLSFTPRPLASYIVQGAQMADAQKLPRYDHATGKITDYDEYNPTARSLEEIAQKAIETGIAVGTLMLVCSKCCGGAEYKQLPYEKRFEVIGRARRDGWKYSPEADTETCPNCAAVAVN